MNEGSQAANVAKRQFQFERRCAKRARVGPLCLLSGREEMIEQALAAGEAPAERLQLGWRERDSSASAISMMSSNGSANRTLRPPPLRGSSAHQRTPPTAIRHIAEQARLGQCCVNGSVPSSKARKAASTWSTGTGTSMSAGRRKAGQAPPKHQMPRTRGLRALPPVRASDGAPLRTDA